MTFEPTIETMVTRHSMGGREGGGQYVLRIQRIVGERTDTIVIACNERRIARFHWMLTKRWHLQAVWWNISAVKWK